MKKNTVASALMGAFILAFPASQASAALIDYEWSTDASISFIPFSSVTPWTITLSGGFTYNTLAKEVTASTTLVSTTTGNPPVTPPFTLDPFTLVAIGSPELLQLFDPDDTDYVVIALGIPLDDATLDPIVLINSYDIDLFSGDPVVSATGNAVPVAPGTPVPETGTLFLFGAGLLGMGFMYRRRAVKRAL
jgi:hypothetical protein